MTGENGSPTQPSSGARLWAALGAFGRFLLRLVFLIVLAAGLGAAVYFGAVYGSSALYRHYVRPVRDNTSRLNTLETMRGLDYEQLSGRLDGLLDRMVTLEARGDTHEETFANLQTQLDSAESAMRTLQAVQAAAESAMGSIQSAQATAESDIESIQSAQATAEAAIEILRVAQATTVAQQSEMQTALGELTASLSALDESTARNRDDIQALGAGQTSEKAALATLQRELQLIKVVELLARSRLFLAQGSPGLAQQDVQSGRSLLVVLQGTAPSYQAGPLAEMIARLDAILENLPGTPVSAAADLEVAWQLLLNGLPLAPENAIGVTPSVGEGTPTLEATVPAAPTPTLTPEATTAP